MFARGLAISVVLLAAGCTGGAPAPATQRLWVSALPDSPRAQVTAFATVRVEAKNYVGSFYRGSALKGEHQAIRWQPSAERGATITFLHDNATREVTLRPCKPDRGFHHCVRLVGGPYGVERYQSRKRWVLPPGTRAASVLEHAAILGRDDDDLQALLSEPP